MQISNTRKGVYNVAFGLFSQIITIALGIIIPRIFLISFGSEMNGLLSSVSQIYSYMALLEAGIGTVTVQAIYKNIGQNNRDGINAVLAATHRYYTKIGRIYIAGIFAFAFVYPLFVKTGIPYWTIWGIIFLNGISQAVSFFIQGKYLLLLQAEGKKYIQTNIGLFIHVATNVVKIALIMGGFHILTIQLSHMLLQLVQMVFISLYIKRNYSWIDLSVVPDFSAISQRKSAFVHQISYMIFHNTDALVLSFVPTCGLLAVSVYSMYNMLLSMISTAVNNINSGIDFILGQSFHKSKEGYLRLHDIYETYTIALTFALYTVAYIFLPPFLRLYTDGITDVSYIDKWLPLLFALVFSLSTGRRAASKVIEYAQHYKATQTRAIIESAINLSVSIMCSFRFGIYGVLLGTIAALLYRTNDMIIYANRVVLQRSPWVTYKRWLSNFALFAVIAVINSCWRPAMDSYVVLILWAVAYTLTVIAAYLLVTFLVNRSVTYALLELIKGKLRKQK